MLPKTLKPMTWQISDMTRTSLKNWLRRCTINPNYITRHYIYLWPQLDKWSVTFCSNSYDGVGGPCRSLMLRINNFPRNGTHTHKQKHTQRCPRKMFAWSAREVTCNTPWDAKFTREELGLLRRSASAGTQETRFLLLFFWSESFDRSCTVIRPTATIPEPRRHSCRPKTRPWLNLVFHG